MANSPLLFRTINPKILNTSWRQTYQKFQPLSDLTQPRTLRNLSLRAYVSPPPSLDTQNPDENISFTPQPIPEAVAPNYCDTTEPSPVKPTPVITWSFVCHLAWKQRLKVLCAVVGLLLGTSCTLIMPQFSGRFFETLIGKRDGPLRSLLFSLAGIYVLEPFCTVLYVTSMVSAWENVMEQIKGRVFGRLLSQKVEFFDRHKVGELTSLLSTELGSIEKMVTENVSRDRGFRSLSEVLGTLVILWFLSKDLAPTFGILMIGISVSVGLYKRATAPLFKLHALAQSKLIDCANESFSAIRTVRSFGGEKRQLWGFREQAAASRESGSKLGFLKSANEAFTRVAVYVSLLVVYSLGGSKVKAGLLPVGTMVAFIGYAFTLTFAVQGLVNTFADLRSVLASVNRINQIASTESTDAPLEDALQPVLDSGHFEAVLKRAGKPSERSRVCQLAWSGDVVLENVWFSYPQRNDADVLRGINLTLPRGTVTALVGPSGAGKSTVVQLLSRFYQPRLGRVMLAGQDVHSFERSDWARAVSLVNQDPVLFAMSVRDNIAYGLPDDEVSEEQIYAAARAANAHDFITKLPQGYDTSVGERGSLLSGGQRQRVAIARAILKDSPILILDEATSALDSVSEKLVQQALQFLMKGRTTLVIAHRLSTVQTADQIAVLSSGKIIELGSHSALISAGGAYAELVNSQRLSFE